MTQPAKILDAHYQLDVGALAPDGTHFVVLRDGCAVLCELGHDSERELAVIGGARAGLVFDGRAIVLAHGESWTLQRFGLDGTVLGTTELAVSGDVTLRGARTAEPNLIVRGDRELVLGANDAVIAELPLAPDPRIPVGNGGWIERRGDTLVLRRGARALTLMVPPDVLAHARLAGGAALLDGTAALELRGRDHRLIVVDLSTGRLRRRLQLDAIAHVRFIEHRGHAVLARNSGQITVLDLLAGRCVRELQLDPLAGIACDAAGRRIVIVTADGGLAVAPYPAHVVAEPEPEPEAEPAAEPQVQPESELERQPDEPSASTVLQPSPPQASINEDAPVTLPTGPLPGLRERTARSLVDDALAEYLTDTLDLVTTCSRLAAARTSAPSELDALRKVANAMRATWCTRWNTAPHRELADDLRLSELASMLLWLIAAPQIWGELASAYRSVSHDGRPLCDELLLAHLFDADTAERAAIARELEPDAPLVRSGAVVVGAGVRPFASVSASPAAVRRLRGDREASVPDSVVLAPPVPPLDELEIPRTPLADLLGALATTNDDARIAIRGSAGSGRRTVATALAQRAGRQLAMIAISDEDTGSRLRTALAEVTLRGWLACIDGNALAEERRAAVRAAIAAHPGPVLIKLAPNSAPPFEGGHCLDLPALDASARARVWRSGLARAGITADAEQLGRRHAIGAGTIHRAIAATPRRGADMNAVLCQAVLAQRDRAVAAIATRVERLADWSQLVVPSDLLATLREMVARVRMRERVLADWGFESVASTARGVTALFQGGPGTGKSLVAGVIARELGRPLYRVDLSRVLSKWIGETEKNLGALFDSAEDGEAVLLFDEADALFAKRTEIKSSNDRYANVQVDYLLQRLDEFSGIAILTSNFGGSIDAALRRRMSFRVTFPFPDADARERLWRAHVPATAPIEGTLDLASLAERYELSGGYIRNAALRAAFLAAVDGSALRMEHFERAVQLEYRDACKIGDGGRLE